MSKFSVFLGALLVMGSFAMATGCQSSRSSADAAKGQDALVVVEDGPVYHFTGGRRGGTVVAYETETVAEYCEHCAADTKAYALTGELTETCPECGKKRHAGRVVNPRPY